MLASCRRASSASRSSVRGSAATRRPRSTRLRRTRSSRASARSTASRSSRRRRGGCGDGSTIVVDRPDRRIPEREARHPLLLSIYCSRGRPDDGRRPFRLRLRLRDAARSGSRERGEGATLNGERLDRSPKDTIEILSFEATLTSLIARDAPKIAELAYRLRIMGSLALSLCHLAAGRVDAVCSLKGARAVDIAAAQLLVREEGLAIELFDDRALVRRGGARSRRPFARGRGGNACAVRAAGRGASAAQFVELAAWHAGRYATVSGRTSSVTFRRQRSRRGATGGCTRCRRARAARRVSRCVLRCRLSRATAREYPRRRWPCPTPVEAVDSGENPSISCVLFRQKCG